MDCEQLVYEMTTEMAETARPATGAATPAVQLLPRESVAGTQRDDPFVPAGRHVHGKGAVHRHPFWATEAAVNTVGGGCTGAPA